MRYNVECPSGQHGWEGFLQEHWLTVEDFLLNDAAFGVTKRLGFKDAQEAWNANPLVLRSPDISDLKRIA